MIMQTTRSYITDASYNMERALERMPLATIAMPVLPTTSQEIARYVKQLLTPEEERICDMATD